MMNTSTAVYQNYVDPNNDQKRVKLKSANFYFKKNRLFCLSEPTKDKKKP